MPFGFFYCTCGIIAVFMASWSASPFLILFWGWVACSFLLVSTAYFVNNPNIFRKKSNGRIPVLAKFFFIPFLLSIHTYNKFARHFDRVPSVQRIDDYLFIADRLTPSHGPIIQEQNIKAVLDLTAEFDSLEWTLTNDNINYLNIPVLDHAVPRDSEIRRAVLWIKNQQSHNGPVLVNCALGRGRSALVVAAYLLSKPDRKTVAAVLDTLKKIRSTVNLNKRQVRLLNRIVQQEHFFVFPKAWIVANPVSGGGKWQTYKNEILNQLSSHYQLIVKESTESESIPDIMHEAVADSPDAIIACGGDGTVSEVAAQIVDTEIKLGIIPSGTTNALCHVLMGVKAKLLPVETACSYIINGQTKKIDTASCNDHLVLLLVGLGFEQRMIESADRKAKDEYGQFAYLRGLWQAVQRKETLKITIVADDEPPRTIETSSLVVANAAPLTTILAQGNGNPDHLDGLLDVTWINTEKAQDNHISGLLELAVSGVFGFSSGYSIQHTHARELYISVEPNTGYVIDGEVFEPSDLCIKIQPESLKVFC